MFSTINNHRLLMMLCLLFLWSCSSEEYTSAKLYLQQQDYAKAEEFLILAMDKEVDNPEIPYQLGHHIYGRTGRWEEMNDAFDKALAINSEAKILDGRTVREFVDISRIQYWTNVYNKGIQTYNDAKGLSDEARQEAIRKAVEEFETAIIIKSNESLNYTMLATCYFELGEADKSAEFIIKAVSNDPENFNANMSAGQILARNHKSNEALPYFQKSVELDPLNGAAIRNLAQTYYDVGDTEASISTYERAIIASTDNKTKADLHFNLGIIYNQFGDFEAAEDNFESALDLNPEDVEAIIGMAQTFESNERWRKAEKFYKELIYLESENPAHYRGMARVLLKQGKQEQAQRYFEKSKKYE